MSPAAFIDANVPIYAAGREHPYKSPCADILRMVAENPQAFITDAEVLQELVHRYLAQGRWAPGPRSPADLCPGDARPDRTGLRGRHPDGDGVGRPASGYKRPGPGPCGSDATPGNRPSHPADTDFDRLPGITRLDPHGIREWGESFQLQGDS